VVRPKDRGAGDELIEQVHSLRRSMYRGAPGPASMLSRRRAVESRQGQGDLHRSDELGPVSLRSGGDRSESIRESAVEVERGPPSRPLATPCHAWPPLAGAGRRRDRLRGGWRRAYLRARCADRKPALAIRHGRSSGGRADDRCQRHRLRRVELRRMGARCGLGSRTVAVRGIPFVRRYRCEWARVLRHLQRGDPCGGRPHG